MVARRVRWSAETSTVDDVALVLIGAAAGGVVTGILGLIDRWRQRRLQRRVGALLIMGDMVVVEAALELVETRRQWPHRYDFMDPVNTWRETRESFASAVEPWQWMLVDGAVSDLRRTAPMARPGQASTASDIEVVSNVKRSLAATQPIVMEHAASKRQLARLAKELKARKAAARSDISSGSTGPGPPTDPNALGY
jgi:hypothetical protein